MGTMRAKFAVADVQKGESCETLTFRAVCKRGGYPEDGSDENNSFARWTPSAELKMSVTNPALHGQFKVGEEYYADFTPAS